MIKSTRLKTQDKIHELALVHCFYDHSEDPNNGDRGSRKYWTILLQVPSFVSTQFQGIICGMVPYVNGLATGSSGKLTFTDNSGTDITQQSCTGPSEWCLHLTPLYV